MKNIEIDDTETKQIMPDDETPNLKDNCHYLGSIDVCVASMLTAYSILIQLYLTEINAYITNITPNLKRHVIICGVETFKNVFSTTMLYTRNLMVTCQTTRHAMSLFFEFISQITNGQFNHIQLSIRDIVLFVYKQTLFKMNDQIKLAHITTSQDKEYHSCLIKYTSIVNTFITHFLPDVIDDNQLCVIGDYIELVNKYLSKLVIMDLSEKSVLISDIHELINNLLDFKMNEVTFFDVLIRILVFYKHKLRHGDMLNEISFRINKNCARIKNIEHLTNDIMYYNEDVDAFVRDLTKLTF